MPISRLAVVLFTVIAAAGATVAVGLFASSGGLGGSGLILATSGALGVAALARLLVERLR